MTELLLVQLRTDAAALTNPAGCCLRGQDVRKLADSGIRWTESCEATKGQNENQALGLEEVNHSASPLCCPLFGAAGEPCRGSSSFTLVQRQSRRVRAAMSYWQPGPT